MNIPRDPIGEVPPESTRGRIAHFLMSAFVLAVVLIVLVVVVVAGTVFYFGAWVKGIITNDHREETHP